VPEIEADGADLHAWAEIYLPGAGWIGFDATSGLITGAGHIPLAASAHPASAAPLTGTVEASAARFHVEMSVTRLPVPAPNSVP
jgi:transglutaminase-like putative cysteine protease